MLHMTTEGFLRLVNWKYFFRVLPATKSPKPIVVKVTKEKYKPST